MQQNGSIQLPSVGDAALDSKVADWMRWDKNPTTRNEVADLVRRQDLAALRSQLLGRLSFGTAGTAAANAGSLSGMRATMAAGFNRLNDLVIIQTTQGMATYVKKQFGDGAAVVIGYDVRHNSERFAHLASNVFLLNKIKVYLFREVVPTPFVPYTVVKRGCAAGLVITASHNPKADNGYKVYWSNGAQILNPHDSGICDEASNVGQPDEASWDLTNFWQSELLFDPRKCPGDVVDDEYMKEAQAYCFHRETNENSPLKYTFTPFHGVGLHFTPQALRCFGIKKENIVLVPEQANFDPEFSTVPSHPNPEEGESVLRWAMEAADTNASTIILANDPDADRFQLSEKQTDGSWRVFSGNEMGALMAWWTWTNWRENNKDKSVDGIYFLNSAVSSKIVSTMSEIEGFNYEETLTGFKWMGNRAEQLRTKGFNVLLSWEESIGFMPGCSLDKDGVLTAAIFAEMAAHLHENGKGCLDQLFEIYKKYGFHLTLNSYFVCDAEQTRTVFGTVRNRETENKYPATIGNQKIKFIRDLTVGYDNSKPDNKPILPVSKSSQMITFTLENGSVITLRGSGTEPKLKYYIELRTEPGKEASEVSAVRAELSNLEQTFVNEIIKPDLHGLGARH